MARRRQGELDGALADATAALDRDPELVNGYNLRASVHYQRGDFAAALADHLKAAELDPDDPGTLNFLAWLRATCPDDGLRDGAQAVRDATRACELTEYRLPGYLDTLAAAHAEAGRYEDAVRWQEKAVKLAAADGRAEYEGRLELYKLGRPYRDREHEGYGGPG